MDGALNLNKPAGITSHDVVGRVRRILKIKRVGHAGTLDPLATGVLLVCVGQATRILELLMGAEKEYEAVMTLGVTTDTEDSSGGTISEMDASHITESQIVQTLPEFRGKISQVPPMVSAVHFQGRRLYELAREGQVVEREPREVEVKSIETWDFQTGRHPQTRLRVVCSKGLYVRTLIADIGAALGVGAHMSELTRTRIGKFRLEESTTLEALEELAREGRAREALIPMAEAVDELPKAAISEGMVEEIRHGRQIPASECLREIESPVAVLQPDGSLAAIARVELVDGHVVLQPTKVLI